MKSVLVIRHAKSSWDSVLVDDFDRTLNERGKKDAPEMATRLFAKNIPIDSFISSPAKRARKTASFFCKAYGISESAIILKEELYLPSTQIFYKVIEEASDRVGHLAIFSHNPAITDFVNSLTNEIRIDNVPTCGVFAIKTDAVQWKNFKKANNQFWFFDYPKNYH